MSSKNSASIEDQWPQLPPSGKPPFTTMYVYRSEKPYPVPTLNNNKKGQGSQRMETDESRDWSVSPPLGQRIPSNSPDHRSRYYSSDHRHRSHSLSNSEKRNRFQRCSSFSILSAIDELSQNRSSSCSPRRSSNVPQALDLRVQRRSRSISRVSNDRSSLHTRSEYRCSKDRCSGERRTKDYRSRRSRSHDQRSRGSRSRDQRSRDFLSRDQPSNDSRLRDKRSTVHRSRERYSKDRRSRDYHSKDSSDRHSKDRHSRDGRSRDRRPKDRRSRYRQSYPPLRADHHPQNYHVEDRRLKDRHVQDLLMGNRSSEARRTYRSRPTNGNQQNRAHGNHEGLSYSNRRAGRWVFNRERGRAAAQGNGQSNGQRRGRRMTTQGRGNVVPQRLGGVNAQGRGRAAPHVRGRTGRLDDSQQIFGALSTIFRKFGAKR